MRLHHASVLFFAMLLAACTPALPPREAPTSAVTVDSTAGEAEATATTAASEETQPAATASTALELPTPTPAPSVEVAATLAPNAIQLRLEPAYQGFELPVFFTDAGDGSGRHFVVEKTGKIWVIDDEQIVPEPFLDLSAKITARGNEQGLLGMAFAPDYATSGHVFVNYTDTAGATTVERYTVSAEDSNRADPASAFVVLTVAQPAQNHNAGMLDFGPDGYLYVPLGDGGASNDRFGNGQNPDALLGKILRLDVTSDPQQPYVVPADNPFVATDWNGQDVRDEVWAIGLRNPWRTSFDRLTGDFWVADVGQNQIEEINVIPAGTAGGLNLGWPIMEGMSCFGSVSCDQAGLTMPAVDYTHRDGNCSVTGGYVYRGDAYPAWNGIYFYGDYCSGHIWAMAQDNAGGWANALIANTDLVISSFGEDQNGELYVVDYGGGTIYRMMPVQ